MISVGFWKLHMKCQRLCLWRMAHSRPSSWRGDTGGASGTTLPALGTPPDLLRINARSVVVTPPTQPSPASGEGLNLAPFPLAGEGRAGETRPRREGRLQNTP